MTSETETEPERGKRRRQRKLFNGVAELYQDTRPGYPDELIDFVVTTAGIAAGGAVLDVGCGTGQLTEPFTSRGFRVTAIDIGPAMIAVAQRRLADANVSFQAVPFEDLDARDGSYDLIVSGAAFHWIDPEVRFTRAARLLRPGGWLAVLGSSERYDEPFGSVLDQMWLDRANNVGAWVTRPGDADAFAASGLFGPPVTRSCAARTAYSADAVIGVENTRATSLSWDEEVRDRFNAELRANLNGQGEVHLTLESGVTMARVRG
jgi:ubiquinone/menaquinone biosynthesis C-methylase UbiE